MSVTSTAVNVDWTLVAGAVGTFIAAIWASVKGLQKGKEKVESGTSSITSVVGGSIMDNMTMRDLSDALRHNSEEVRRNTEQLREVERAMTRQADIDLMQNRKLDFRDTRDNPD